MGEVPLYRCSSHLGEGRHECARETPSMPTGPHCLQRSVTHTVPGVILCRNSPTVGPSGGACPYWQGTAVLCVNPPPPPSWQTHHLCEDLVQDSPALKRYLDCIWGTLHRADLSPAGKRWLKCFQRLSPGKWLKPRPKSGLDWLIVFQIARQRSVKYDLHHHCSPPEPKPRNAAPLKPSILNDKNLSARSRDLFFERGFSPLPNENPTTKKGLSRLT